MSIPTTEEYGTINVVWWSRARGAPATGYWDQGDLLRLLSRMPGMPHPTPWPTFRHHTVEGPEALWPDLEGAGAVVIVPGRYHTDPEHLAALNVDLSRLRWVVLIVCGDEEHLFPLDMVHHPTLRAWVMTPEPTLPGDAERQRRTWEIGEGSPPHTDHGLWRLAHGTVDETARDLDWSFAGQITHERRVAAQHGMALCVDAGLRGEAHFTEGFGQGLNQRDYLALMMRSKVIPCPGGPATPSTFRVWEALEAGCVPIVEGGAGGYEYWRRLLGDHPLPVIIDWSTLPHVMREVVDVWPLMTLEVQQWWQWYKWRTASQLVLDIGAGRGVPASMAVTPGDSTTVIITCSPIPSHPSTELLEETMRSVMGQAQLAGCQIIVACDGVRDEQIEMLRPYVEFCRRVAWLCAHDYPNALPLFAGEHRHQANMLRDVLEVVATPLVLVLEHDTPLHGPIDWDGIAAWLKPTTTQRAAGINLVRLYHEGVVPAEHRHMMLDDEPITGEHRAPIIRTSQWSQRPHLARAGWYRELLAKYFGDDSRTFVEDVMHGVVDHAYREHGVVGWHEFGTAIYAPAGDMRRSGHTDGRGEDPKFPLVFEYPGGDTPEGAPRATSQRVD